jgi:glycosyltransferase involved in cell wall biosynthesis
MNSIVSNKKLVILRAPCLTLSGYGQHSRQIGDWLLQLDKAGYIELYCDALFWGNTTWIVDYKRDPLVEELMKRCVTLPRKPDISLQLQLPNEWDPNLATINIGITAAVETDVAPTEWVACCEKMDKIVFPSQHSLSSITNAGWKPKEKQAHVIPESFPNALMDVVDTSVLDPLPPFTFLIFGQLTASDKPEFDRKNTHNTIKWILEEFADDPDVGILIKTNLGRNSVFDGYHTHNTLQEIHKQVSSKMKNKKLPEIHFIHGDMLDEQVATLYKHPNVKALVTATRGEGFGLPILEAAACDLPVIATGWSAHKEFLELGRYIDLPCVIKEIPKGKADGRIFVSKAKWAEVDEKDFKRRLRKFRNSSSIPKEWAIDLGKKIRSSYCRESNIAKWDETFGALLKGQF